MIDENNIIHVNNELLQKWFDLFVTRKIFFKIMSSRQLKTHHCRTSYSDFTDHLPHDIWRKHKEVVIITETSFPKTQITSTLNCANLFNLYPLHRDDRDQKMLRRENHVHSRLHFLTHKKSSSFLLWQYSLNPLSGFLTRDSHGIASSSAFL